MQNRPRRSLSVEKLDVRQLLAADLILPELFPETSLIANYSAFGSATADVLSPEGEGDGNGLSEHDPYLPDFSSAAQTANRRVFRSVANGNWNDQFANVRSGDVVIIGHDVVFNTTASMYSLVIANGGRLRFATTGNQSLNLVNFEVLYGGTLEIGTAAQPHLGRVDIVIRDVPIDTNLDPAQYGHGLVVLGKVTMHGRAIANTYANTSDDMRSGNQSLAVTNAADWQVGDKILVPDSRLLFYTAPTVAGLTRYETAVVKSTSGTSVQLENPLSFDHVGARDSNNLLAFKPYVANLSRNIVIRSENPNGVRGHTMFIEQATMDVRYVEFRDLGRTLNATQLDNTQFDAHGVATKIGTNQIGRYAVHIHHLIGPSNLSADTPQFRFTGNSVNNTTVNDRRWGIALHGAHYGLVDKNVVYNFAGAGIVTEDGDESFNTFSQNFVSRIPGTRNRGKFSDGTEGLGFWFKRPNNYVNDNVVTGADKAAYAIYGGDNTESPPVEIPAFKGANPHDAGGARLLAPKLMNLLSFNNNEAYASHIGIEIWYLGYKTYYDPADEPVPQTLISGFKGWFINMNGVFGEQANNVRFENMRLLNPVNSTDINNVPVGFNVARAKEVSIVNSTIENFRYGVYTPGRLDRLGKSIPFSDIKPFILKNTKLRNFINIGIGMPIEDASPDTPPRYILIDNIDFDDDPKNPLPNKTDISMMYSDGRFTNIMQTSVVEVTSYNRDPRSNFQLFFKQQAPEFVVPVTGLNGPASPTGAPVAGLTNEQLWARYGVAIAGQVAPGGVNSGSRLTYPNVDGLAFPLTRSNTGIAILSISPDTGNVGDRRTAAQQIIVSGVANPGTDIVLFDGSSQLGLTRTNQAGLWALDLSSRTLATGRHSLVARQVNSSNASGVFDFDILTNKPQLNAPPVSIPEDLPSGSLVRAVTAVDADQNDALRFEIISGNAQGLFQINPNDGRITLTRSNALDPNTQPLYRLGIRVTDSVGLLDQASLDVTVTKRPPGFWITQLDYQQFLGLAPEEIVFLTPQQVASIPDVWWFSRIPAASRAVLTPSQLSGLNTAAVQMLLHLTRQQQLTLPANRFALVPFTEFASVIPERVSDLSLAQIRAISSDFWLGRVSSAVLSRFTVAQIQAINTSLPNMLAWLTNSQRISLSDQQIAALGYGDLRYVPAERASAITTQQLAGIPDSYWFSQLPLAVRSQLNAPQVNALNLAPGGILPQLTQSQILLLNQAKIRTLGFTEFRFLPPEQIVKLSRIQLLTLKDNFWYYSISAASRQALTASGARWIDNVGFVFN